MSAQTRSIGDLYSYGTEAEKALIDTNNIPPGFRYFETDTGAQYQWNGATWVGSAFMPTGTQVGSSVAAEVVDVTESPKQQYTPTVGGTSQAEIALVDTAGNIIGARVSINAGDDVVAATRLMNGYPDVVVLSPDQSISIVGGSNITRVDVVGIGTATDTTGHTVLYNTSVLADVTSAMVTALFNSSDNINRINITFFPTWSAGVNGLIHVEGYSYA